MIALSELVLSWLTCFSFQLDERAGYSMTFVFLNEVNACCQMMLLLVTLFTFVCLL